MNNFDINKLNECLSSNRLNKKEKECFLSIIGREYDECIISKLLLYFFNNINVLKELIKREDINFIKKSLTELSIDMNRRIDLFFEGEFLNNKKFIIIIENKICSDVHGNQCKDYYEWANRYYKGYEIYCFLLKPYFNSTKPDDDHFKVITYDEIFIMIDDTEDIYLNELRKEIKNYLMKKEYNELDYFLLNNLKDINGKIQDLWKNINDYVERLINEVNFDNRFTKHYTYSQDHSYFKLYDNKEGWWSGDKKPVDEQYYFYFEI